MRDRSAGPVRLLVLQATPFCNLDCAYCYLPHRDDSQRMSGDVLDAIGRNIVAGPLAEEPLSIVWHGGEPMTLPPDWYEEAFARIDHASGGRTVRHAFQTNAIGINDSWVRLFRQRDVRIGVSIDGPRAVHDAYRKTRGGRGSHELSMRGAARLSDAGLPFHLISVLTADSLSQPDALFDFYVAHGFRDVCFNVEEQEGAHPRSGLEGLGTEAVYRRFLDRFFARIAAADAPFACRELDAARALALTPSGARRANPQTRPLEIVTVAADGAMSTYSPELIGTAAPQYADFSFGNVCEGGPERILDHPAFRRLRADIDAGVAACAAGCAWFDVCGGGAPANKFFEHGHLRGTETLFCRLTRQTGLEAALATLEADVAA
ncbi:cyclophane-forming radical SAM/SPASM peptide maturase GrrM/OscB [Roseobacter ponti]|uniref:GRRM system radical SAM/SPASM domain protein n=1 Tax=Roseobacter ponti TaxID=1891787 RepID=A0A858SSE1_9RHOB|nr:cyclophane-forming radical SAM/SPASM peptide maturase GrrM/OscB [Roseobacter ponti]QJF51829.1 GRRM system radical SAM/SPASM domain protein [Roseobacter ponti]